MNECQLECVTLLPYHNVTMFSSLTLHQRGGKPTVFVSKSIFEI